jgi:hypothetical protein
MSFRTLRIAILLLVLVLAGGLTWWGGMLVRSWLRPLDIVIYPVNGDGAEETTAYIAGLDDGRFQPIGTFLDAQAGRYRLKQLPQAHIRLGNPVTELPPPPPPGARGALDSVLWSLRTRYYAYRHTPFWASLGQIRLFVVYHQGEEDKPLQHSLGLRKGLIGVVHVFARPEMAEQNQVVIAHELLHTLGATDKYDHEGHPLYPDGFAEAEDGPRYPQRDAELMAGRRPLSPTRSEIPESLARCVIGPKTAYEINW